jgi:hypothetical protein
MRPHQSRSARLPSTAGWRGGVSASGSNTGRSDSVLPACDPLESPSSTCSRRSTCARMVSMSSLTFELISMFARPYLICKYR